MTINWTRMQELRNFLSSMPAQAFDHGTWGNEERGNNSISIKVKEANVCGTAACIAGWGGMLWDLGEPKYIRVGDRSVLDTFYDDVGGAVGGYIGLNIVQQGIVFYPWEENPRIKADVEYQHENPSRLGLLHNEPTEENVRFVDTEGRWDTLNLLPKADLRTAVKFLDICIAKREVLLRNWVEAGDAVRAEEQAIREALQEGAQAEQIEIVNLEEVIKANS
jgi:hypothetical protein